MADLHRLLFEQLGRGTDATFGADAVEAISDDSVRSAMHKGLLRALPLGPVPCRVPSCAEDCELRAERVPDEKPAKGKVRMYRLVCPRGLARDRLVTEREITAYEVRLEMLLKLLARSNGAVGAFDAAQRLAQHVVAVGRLPWCEGALLCLAVGLGRRPVAPQLAAATTLGKGPMVVLVPPPVSLAAIERGTLAAHGVHAFEMDPVIDWGLLELRRHLILEEVAAAGAGSADTAADTAGLVLYRGRCEASFMGYPLDLAPLRFGFLLALAESAGRVVSRDQISTIAYGVLAENRRRAGGKPFDPQEADPEQMIKLKSEVLAALKRLAASGHVPPEAVAGIITAKRGVGFRLDCAHVEVRD